VRDAGAVIDGLHMTEAAKTSPKEQAMSCRQLRMSTEYRQAEGAKSTEGCLEGRKPQDYRS
jgi:hypothetical protein